MGSFESLFINLAKSTPEAVPMAKATSPRPRMPKVSVVRNLEEVISEKEAEIQNLTGKYELAKSKMKD